MNQLTAFALALVLASCEAGTGAGCSREPVGRVNAFFTGGEASRDVVATVTSIAPLPEIGGFRYEMADGARLTWIAREPIPHVVAGRRYRFVVEYAGGSPDASGILVFGGDDLLFAALTDQKPFQHVLRDGIPGFTITTEDAGCSSRGSTRCHESLINHRVSFAHRGENASRFHGEKATLGEFEVEVLTAQNVTYASRCADAGLPGIAFTIRREP